MQGNGLDIITRICEKEQIKAAFYKIYNHSAEGRDLTEEERDKLIYMKLFKVELTLYRKLWVKL